MARNRRDEENEQFQPKETLICPLCNREIPDSHVINHHVIPKLKGGTETVPMHKICHQQIYALFSEAELAQNYNTVALLLENEDIIKFVKWVKNKPNDFFERSKASNNRR